MVALHCRFEKKWLKPGRVVCFVEVECVGETVTGSQRKLPGVLTGSTVGQTVIGAHLHCHIQGLKLYITNISGLVYFHIVPYQS